jgi:regulator of cell morphogenesis and NO signaling
MDRFADAARPLDALCEDIVDRYHAALHRELPAIREDLAALCTASGSSTFREVRGAFDGLADLIEGHLAKEEHLLFPALEALAAADREGRRRPAMPFVALVHPIRMMEAEHLRIESAMDHLRDLVLEVEEPDSLLPGWRRCLSALARLDRELQDHHRCEGDHLFPRALELEHRLLV